jgi:hypothetical protein
VPKTQTLPLFSDGKKLYEITLEATALNGISENPSGNEKLNQSISLSSFDSKKSGTLTPVFNSRSD